VNITCAMTLLATTFAITSFAQEPKRPDKAEAIRAIEQSIGGRFVQEHLSKDMPTVQLAQNLASKTWISISKGESGRN